MIGKFIKNVKITTGCWGWKGFVEKNGYGKTGFNGKREWAHRVSYILFNGEIPKGKEIDHLCGNPSCVNPAHLEAVTHKENMNRSKKTIYSIRREKKHCPSGHPYSGENLIIYKGMRYCRECQRKHKRAYKRKLRTLDKNSC